MAEQYFIRRDFADIFPFLDSVSAHADGERKALGFLPEAAYAEAARQRKLILLVAQNEGKTTYVGHLLFGGMFPILRVRQISIAPKYRKLGHATTLLRTLIAQGEKEGYLNIVANVATDLRNANSFYEKNGFLSSRVKAGGRTRNRTINVRILQLETPSLISYMVGPAPPKAIQILQPKQRSPDVPIYAIDLNVFFDVIRDRNRSNDAGIVFEAAFNHQIRIAVSQEFISELRRTSSDPNNDPALSLAKRIPTLPPQERANIDNLVPIIAKAVFPERAAQQRLKPTDKSDVLHLAHAILAGASGYITSDAKILASRDTLLNDFKLDIIGLSEFVDLLDLPSATEHSSPTQPTRSFHIRTPTIEEVATFLRAENISLEAHAGITLSDCRRSSVFDDHGLIGISLLKPSSALDQPSRSVVCVHQEHPFSSTVADFLISEQIRYCSNKAACHLLMTDIPFHPITRRIALGHGFQNVHGKDSLIKMALGQPVTEALWNKARLSVERVIGIKIQRECPRYDKPEVKIINTAGTVNKVGLFDLETFLSPTLFILPKRKAVVVPITRNFAADLLGTDTQYSFLEVPEARFLSRRTYFNTTRAARAMIRGAAIAFYESRKHGGRGAIVAVGRIVDVTSIPIDSTPEALQRGAVVEDVKVLTKSSRVLATTFDNLVALRRPVPLETLRQIGCVTGSNFVSATPISTKHLAAIVDAGRADE